MQFIVFGELPRSWVCHACSLQVDQLPAAGSYAELLPTIAVRLLTTILHADTPVPHHRLRSTNEGQGRVLANTVRVHTVELTKYIVKGQTVSKSLCD